MQVIVEVTSYVLRIAGGDARSRLAPSAAGLATGVIPMYATAMLVKI